MTKGAVFASYHGISPDIAGPIAFAGTGAAVLGRCTMGSGAWLGAHAVIRADGHVVTIGDDFHLGSHGTVHIAHELYPAQIGNRVTAGAGACIHACTVADGCVVDSGAVILDGSIVGPGAVIAAGATVFPRSNLEGGWLYEGSPAVKTLRVSTTELNAHHQRVRSGPPEAVRPASATIPTLDCFVAPTARVAGTIRVGEGVGIWYGCEIDAGDHRVEIGAGTNVQDNTSIACQDKDVVIGPDVTVGHNVTMCDCRIGADCLIGIGSVIAPGTVIEGDVLLAAGAWTEPGQVLSGGSVWAGRPARATRPMNPKFRGMLAEILPQYREYADHFRAQPHSPLVARQT